MQDPDERSQNLQLADIKSSRLLEGEIPRLNDETTAFTSLLSVT